jgi:hypothetical protein
MMTVASPLMGKELAKFLYLLIVPNRVDSPTAIRCYLEGDAYAREVTALGAPPRLVISRPARTRKSERFCLIRRYLE